MRFIVSEIENNRSRISPKNTDVHFHEPIPSQFSPGCTAFHFGKLDSFFYEPNNCSLVLIYFNVYIGMHTRVRTSGNIWTAESRKEILVAMKNSLGIDRGLLQHLEIPLTKSDCFP